MTNTSSSSASASSGIGLFGLTFIVLLVLKLTNLASISWLVVFLPLIIGFGLTILFLLIAFVIILFASK